MHPFVKQFCQVDFRRPHVGVRHQVLVVDVQVNGMHGGGKGLGVRKGEHEAIVVDLGKDGVVATVADGLGCFDRGIQGDRDVRVLQSIQSCLGHHIVDGRGRPFEDVAREPDRGGKEGES